MPSNYIVCTKDTCSKDTFIIEYVALDNFLILSYYQNVKFFKCHLSSCGEYTSYFNMLQITKRAANFNGNSYIFMNYKFILHNLVPLRLNFSAMIYLMVPRYC